MLFYKNDELQQVYVVVANMQKVLGRKIWIQQ